MLYFYMRGQFVLQCLESVVNICHQPPQEQVGEGESKEFLFDEDKKYCADIVRYEKSLLDRRTRLALLVKKKKKKYYDLRFHCKEKQG